MTLITGVLPEVRYRNKITYLGFALALLIVIRHSVGITVYDMPGWLYYFESFISYATDMVVPMFFAMSGYLFFQNFDYSKLRIKFWSRVKSLVIPFIIWNLVGWLFYFVISRLPLGVNNESLSKSLTSVCSFVREVFLYTNFNITWFLGNLIVYTFTLPLLFGLLKRKSFAIGVGIVLIISALCFENKLLSYSLPYYWGAIVGIHFKEWGHFDFSTKSICIATGLLVISIIANMLIGIQGAQMVLLRLVQIPLIWIIANVFASEVPPKWWMTISFFIYCCHHMILTRVRDKKQEKSV